MSAPVLTITLNPAIDQTVILPQLCAGSVNLAESSQCAAGGKGINVAACLADLGIPVAAGGFLGKRNEDLFRELFNLKGIDDHFVRLDGNTRTNLKLVNRTREETTDINLPGFPVPREAIRRLYDSIGSLAQSGHLVALCGSLPADLDAGVWAQLVAAFKARRCTVLLDTSGEALKRALAMPPHDLPDIIKPNLSELEEWAGTALPNTASLLAVARELCQTGVDLVAVSLGEEGALLVRGDEVLHARLAASRVASTVGAGDAMVAGLLAARRAGLDLAASARRAVAAAVGKLARLGPHLPDAATLAALEQRVQIRALR
ncbi:1-phosphofructokinase [Paludibacterium paludis]|uniref:Phosphofructokinase n=1 Tax=Paludibacterium paludis TaxID=1225769 RepID=A0A918U8B3_9NEIS|nr:1-phosphofructokinase [Paludibacterium paludis]GGY08273.1 phosphofructokinase [Paludibacterium paludis]